VNGSGRSAASPGPNTSCRSCPKSPCWRRRCGGSSKPCRAAYFCADERGANRRLPRGVAATEGAPIRRGTGQARYGPGLRAGHGLVRISTGSCRCFPSRDALIKDAATFAQQLKQASELAAKHDTIVTFWDSSGPCLDPLRLLEAGAALPESNATCPSLRWSALWRSRTWRGGNIFEKRKILLERGHFSLEDEHVFARGEALETGAG